MRVSLPPGFVDARGSIQNIVELGEGDTPIRGVAIIRTRAGEVRSNHWHQKDFHFLHVLSGKVRYEWRPVDSRDEPLSDEYEAGETFFTGARVWHRVTSLTDSVMVSASRLSRTHEEHEADLVRDDG